jgi:ribosomal-protein-alanine N-acetyltransferase
MSLVAVSIRPLQVSDADTLAALYSANREFLEPFDPPRPDGFATSAAQRRELKALQQERAADRLERFLISSEGEPAGVISVSRISRGPFQNAGLGYWVIERLNGRGIATTAVGLVCEWGFGEAGFHRLEAATLVDNTGSQTVLRRNGFTEIGLSPKYLFINGAWRDHILFARTAED